MSSNIIEKEISVLEFLTEALRDFNKESTHGIGEDFVLEDFHLTDEHFKDFKDLKFENLNEKTLASLQHHLTIETHNPTFFRFCEKRVRSMSRPVQEQQQRREPVGCGIIPGYIQKNLEQSSIHDDLRLYQEWKQSGSSEPFFR